MHTCMRTYKHTRKHNAQRRVRHTDLALARNFPRSPILHAQTYAPYVHARTRAQKITNETEFCLSGTRAVRVHTCLYVFARVCMFVCVHEFVSFSLCMCMCVCVYRTTPNAFRSASLSPKMASASTHSLQKQTHIHTHTQS